MCGGRAQGSQIFKWNSIILIRSKVMAFLVISLSPHGPHVVPVVPMSSPHCSHSPQKVPMWSPWLWSPWSPPYVVPVVPTSSPSSTHCPCHPHVPVIPMSSPLHLEGPHIIPNPPDTHSTHPLPLGGWDALNQ